MISSTIWMVRPGTRWYQSQSGWCDLIQVGISHMIWTVHPNTNCISHNLDGKTKNELVSATIWMAQPNTSWYQPQSGWHSQIRVGFSHNLDGTTKYELVSVTIWILRSNRSWYPAQSGWCDQVKEKPATIWKVRPNTSWYQPQSGWYDQIKIYINHNLDVTTKYELV